MARLRQLTTEFFRNTRGNLSIIVALASLPFIVAGGMVVDTMRMNDAIATAQASVDAAALAGAATNKPVYDITEEVTLNGNDAKIHAAMQMVEANVPESLKKTMQPLVRVNGNQVKVDLKVSLDTLFMRLASINKVDLSVTATAEGKSIRACVIALGSDGDGVQFNGSAAVEAPECWIYSNREGADSIYAGGTSRAEAAGLCAVGDASIGNNTTVTPTPTTDCTPIRDPMSEWVPPDTSWLCDYNNFKKQANAANKDIVLEPGVYCGGLKANGFDNVTLNSGIYFITGGALDITSKLTLSGAEVGFYLASDVASVTINGSAGVKLTAPLAPSPMAGLIIAMQPGGPSIKALINGTSDLYWLGTVYLPTADIELSGTSSTLLSPLAQVIGYSVNLKGTSILKFETEFEEAGFKPMAEIWKIRLID